MMRFQDTTVRFRRMAVTDMEEVRALHETWFPVRYSTSFYEAAVRERMVGTHDPLFTLIAEADGRIIGLITAQMTWTRGCGDEGTLYKPAAAFHLPETARVMYVLTLGADQKYRRRGIAREMLKRCIARANDDPGCGVVYLHVITHNAGAIEFYRSNNFQFLGEIHNYYRIDGNLFNCYVYAYYLPKAVLGVHESVPMSSDEDTNSHDRPEGDPDQRPPDDDSDDAGSSSRFLGKTLSVLLPPSLRSCFRPSPPEPITASS